jgi:shikimate dehydrogenase
MDAHTRLYWLLGHPVKQTVSPGLFNRAFAAAQENAALIAIDTPPEHLGAALALLRHASNVQGCLLTIPYKQAVVKYLDVLTPRSQALGMVNIVRKTPQGLEGDALDGLGFTGALVLHGHAVRGKRVLVIGCGGAGVASAWQALEEGAFEVGLFDVDASRIVSLATSLAAQFGDHRVRALSQPQGDWHIVLNASPLGMREGDALPMPVEDLSHAALLVDATTPAQPSRWLSQAAQRGHAVIHGQDFTHGQVLAMAEFFGLSSHVQSALKELKRA